MHVGFFVLADEKRGLLRLLKLFFEPWTMCIAELVLRKVPLIFGIFWEFAIPKRTPVSTGATE